MGQSYEARGRRNGGAREAFRTTAEEVMEDFAELRRDVSKLVDAAGLAARGEVSETRDRIERLGRGVRDKALDRASSMADQVREHPGAAVGATLGIGVLIGLLLSSRRH
jgi:ElaB/YqjD/DUF883 family membrane-anchored ribosome-binding protein